MCGTRVGDKIMMYIEKERQRNLELKDSVNAKRVLVLVVLGIMTFLIMMYSTQSIWKKTESWTDSSVFKYVAFVMSKGGMPYADTFDHKGPLLYLLNFLGIQIGYMRGIWIVEFACMFATLISMYKIARLFCSRVTSCVTVLICSKWIFSYFQYGNFTEEYAMLPICVATFIFLDYMLNHKVNKLRLILCGVSLSAVLLLRANMIAIWIAFCIVIFVKSLCEKDWKKLTEFMLYFLLGMCILMIPIVLWLSVNGAFDEFIQNYIVFNLRYSSEAGGRALTTTKWDSFIYFFNQDIVLYAVMIILYLCVCGKHRLVARTYLFHIFLLFLMLSMSGRQYGHYGLTIVPALVYPIAYLNGEIENNYKKSKNPLVLVILMYFLVTFVLPTWINSVNNIVQTYENRENSNYGTNVRKVVDIVLDNTKEEEFISVYGNWNIIYILSERLSASKYSYQFSIGKIEPKIMDEYFEEISENNPKVIVIQENRLDERMENFLEKYGYELYWSEKKDASGCQVYMQ